MCIYFTCQNKSYQNHSLQFEIEEKWSVFCMRITYCADSDKNGIFVGYIFGLYVGSQTFPSIMGKFRCFCSRCPYCEFAAVVGGNDKVFSCQNPSCMKVSESSGVNCYSFASLWMWVFFNGVLSTVCVFIYSLLVGFVVIN